jgi:PAS domain S-box-containing protein
MKTPRKINTAFLSLDSGWHFSKVKAIEVFKNDLSDLTGKNIWEAFPELKGSTFYNTCTEAMEKQEYRYWEGALLPGGPVTENHLYPSPTELYIMMRDLNDGVRPDENRELENSLSESIIRGLPGLFYLYDDTGKFIDWNTNFELVSGYTGTEISGMHPLEFFDEPQKKALEEKIQEVFDKGEAFIEADFYTKDRKHIPFYFNGYSIHYKNKRCLLGMGIDLSERVAAEKKKTEIEGQFRALFENSMDGILLTQTDGKILLVNPAACKLFGMTAGEIRNAGRDGLTDPTDPRVTTFLEERRKKKRIKGEMTLLRKGGESFPAEVTASVFTDVNGQEMISLIIRDIVHQKKAETFLHRLNENEQNLQLIFSSTYDIIFLLSLEPGNRFKFISVNDAFLTITGLKPEQVIHKYLDEVIPPDSLPLVMKKYNAAVQTKSRMQWEETSEYPSGKKTGIVTITPVSDENGDCKRLIGFVHDITERKKAEEDLDRMNKQLRNLSNHMQTIAETERTGIAREIHDVLGQQMTALKYDVAWLKKRKDNEPEIHDRLISMNKLVDETIHSIRKVSSELRPRMIDDLGLNAAIEWYATEFEKNTSIHCQIDSDLEEVQFEKPVSITMYRILQEALTNVARHSGATEVNIIAKRTPQLITLQITDNGKGVSESEKENPLSFGLLGMAERAKMIGGTLLLSGSKTAGTTVLLEVPVSGN